MTSEPKLSGVEFQELPALQRKVLLNALGFDTTSLTCLLCKEKTTLEECSILPSLIDKEREADILCNSPLCLAEWMEEIEP